MMWIIVFLLFAILCTLTDMNEKQIEKDEFYDEEDLMALEESLKDKRSFVQKIKDAAKDFHKSILEMK